MKLAARQVVIGMVAGTVLLAALAAGLGGCSDSLATIKYVHPALGQQKVETREAAFQFARGGLINIVLVKQWALPAGEAAPDYEYLQITVPEKSGRHQVGQQLVQAYRLVSTGGRQTLYEATAGTVNHRFSGFGGHHVVASFDLEFKPVTAAGAGGVAGVAGGQPAETVRLTGKVEGNDDLRESQAMINRYEPAIRRLEAAAKAPVPPPAAKEKKKESPTPAAASPAETTK